MQRELSLHATEAERIALSQSSTYLIPIKNMIEYVITFIRAYNKEMNDHSTLFEDNIGNLQLATEANHRPRTKCTC